VNQDTDEEYQEYKRLTAVVRGLGLQLTEAGEKEERCSELLKEATALRVEISEQYGDAREAIWNYFVAGQTLK